MLLISSYLSYTLMMESNMLSAKYEYIPHPVNNLIVTFGLCVELQAAFKLSLKHNNMVSSNIAIQRW